MGDPVPRARPMVPRLPCVLTTGPYNRISLGPSWISWCPSLFSPPPPPPFTVQTYLSRYPPDQRESIFVVVSLALSPSVPPGLGPFDLLTAARPPFHVHSPHSYAMLVVHSHLALNRHIALIMRSVDEPAPRARPTGPRLPCLLTTGP